MNQRLKSLIIILGLILSTQACSKNSCVNSKSGVLKDYTDIDGCGWIILLDDGTKLEPINLSEFDIALENGKKISVRYKYSNSGSLICMTGKRIELQCIKKR